MAKQRTKQKFLPGTEPGGLPKLDQLALNYYDAVQERLPLTKAEAEAKEALMVGMREEKLVRYLSADELEVILNESFGVKCKKKSHTEENGDGEE